MDPLAAIAAPKGDASARVARAAELAALAALLGVALLSWSYFAFAHPVADDFGVAVLGRELGAAGYANFIWETKSGRWTGHALLAVLLGRLELVRAYPWLLAGAALVGLGASYVFLRVLLAEAGTRAAALTGALAFQALLWAGAPSVGQTHYWFSGVVPYQLGVWASVLVVAGLVACTRRARGGVLGWIVLPLLGLSVPGLQELTGMMLALALAAGSWAAFRLRLARRWLWPWSCALVAAGCVASVLAPGNAVRAAEHPQGGDALRTLAALGPDAWHALRDWFLEPRVLALTALLGLSSTLRRPRPRWVDADVPWGALLALTGLAALLIGLAGPRYATGAWMPPRMLTATYLVSLHAWLALVLVGTRRAPAWPLAPARRAGAMAAAALVLVLGLALSGNGRTGLGDLWHERPQRFARSREQRYRLLQAARAEGQRALVLPYPPYTPRVFPAMDIGDDPGFWMNQWMARYFGLEAVALEPRPGP